MLSSASLAVDRLLSAFLADSAVSGLGNCLERETLFDRFDPF